MEDREEVTSTEDPIKEASTEVTSEEVCTVVTSEESSTEVNSTGEPQGGQQYRGQNRAPNYPSQGRGAHGGNDGYQGGGQRGNNVPPV